MSERLTPMQPEKLSIRAKLRTLALAAVMTSGLAGGPPSEEPFDRQIERRFNITLLTPEEISEWDLSEWQPKINNRDWDLSRLDLLANTLPNFPEHFYGKDSGGNNLEVVIAKSGKGNSCICDPRDLETTNRRPILLAKDEFNERQKRHSVKSLVHELIHRIQPWSKYGPEYSPLGYYGYISPWVLKRDEILTGNTIFQFDRLGNSDTTVYEIVYKLNDLRPGVFNTVLSHELSLNLDNLTEDEEKVYFANRLKYSIGFPSGLFVGWDLSHYDMEFFAVLGETYIEGREYFFKMYGEYFEPEQVEGLYKLAKDEIFDGWEYYNLKPISKPLEDRS